MDPPASPAPSVRVVSRFSRRALKARHRTDEAAMRAACPQGMTPDAVLMAFIEAKGLAEMVAERKRGADVSRDALRADVRRPS